MFCLPPGLHSQPAGSGALKRLPAVIKENAASSASRAGRALESKSLAARRAALRGRLNATLRGENQTIYCPAEFPAGVRAQNNKWARAQAALARGNMEKFLSYSGSPARAEYVKTVDYARLIPSSAKLVFLGEVHGYNVIHRELRRLFRSYRAAYPSRRIYLLAESVSADGNLYQASAWPLNGPYSKEGASRRELLETLVKQDGVILAGLERPGLVRAFNSNFDTRLRVSRKYVSWSGMETRNAGFAARIAELRRMDPDGIIFVYGGKAHWSYAHAGSVPLLMEAGEKAFVMDFTPSGMRPALSMESVWNAWLETRPARPEGTFGVYQAAGKKEALLLGTDVKIETPEDFIADWRP